MIHAYIDTDNRFCYVHPDRELDDMLKGIGDKASDLLREVSSFQARLKALREPDANGGLESVVESLRNMDAQRPYTDEELEVIVKAGMRLGKEYRPTAEYIDETAKMISSMDDCPERRVLVDCLSRASSEYMRERVWSSSLANRVIPVERATVDMLARDGSESLRIWWEKEPDSPAAAWVPLDTAPDPEYVRSSRYCIPIARLLSPDSSEDYLSILSGRKFSEDIDKLADACRDELDGKFLGMVDSIVFNADGPSRITDSGVQNPNLVTGKPQWMDLPDTEDGFVEATKMLPCGNSNGKFVVRNFMAAMSRETFDKFSAGKAAQDVFKGNVALFDDKADGSGGHGGRFGRVYFFAEPLFLGKFFMVNDFTMYIRSEAFLMRYFAYFLGGFAIGNVGAVAVARFQTDGKE